MRKELSGIKTDFYSPAFVLDVHLYRLCKYLRMAGFDCLWRADYSDSELLLISNIENRYLLTRDRALFCRTNPELGYFVQSVHPRDQIEEIVKNFGLGNKIRKGEHFLSRCLKCNTLIERRQLDQIDGSLLPQNVKLHQDEFFGCPNCKRIYWKGSHYDRMKNWLSQISEVDPGS